ncbi:MAG: hypothetical protein ACE14Q_09255 [Acidobacteriota bacterium]
MKKSLFMSFLFLALLSAKAHSQQMPWFLFFERPLTFSDIDQTQCPSTHPNENLLDSFVFQVGTVDIRTGQLSEQAISDLRMNIYFSTEGVPASLQPQWQGAHFHNRETDETHRRVTLGGIETDPLSDDSDYSATAIEVLGLQGRLENIKVWKPEAAGVIRIHGESTLPNVPQNSNFCALDNEYWHKVLDKPTQTCAKKWVAEWGVYYLILDLVELPETYKYYVRARTAEGGNNPYHPNPYAYYGTQGMVNSLKNLAKAYYEDKRTKEQKLRIKDMSLEWGGILDIDGDWSCPHVRHRTGRSVDLSRYTIKIVDGNSVLEDIDIKVLKDKLNNTTLRLNDKEWEKQGKIHLDYTGR